MSKFNVNKVKAGDLELKDKVVFYQPCGENYKRWSCIQFLCTGSCR